MLAIAAPASAETKVPPGTGTLQAAIDAASPGASLVLTGGNYVGPVVIDKPLRITCKDVCEIDANCEAAVALDIAADGVMLRSADPAGVVSVSRGTDTQIRIANRTKIKLRIRINAVKPFLNSCGTEQNGIEVSGTSTRVKLVDARGLFFPGAGLLLSGLAPRASVKVSYYFGLGNAAGISVVDSGVGSKLGGSGITIDRSTFSDNEVGLSISGSDGLRVTRSNFRAKADPPGQIGIALDAASNRALVKRNAWTADDGTGVDHVDAGTGSCGVANTGFSFPSCP